MTKAGKKLAGKCGRCVQEEEHETLCVPVAHAVADPWAVVVHAKHTHTALLTGVSFVVYNPGPLTKEKHPTLQWWDRGGRGRSHLWQNLNHQDQKHRESVVNFGAWCARRTLRASDELLVAACILHLGVEDEGRVPVLWHVT